MTPAAVTAALVHDLAAGSHAEGITALAVEAAIEHDDRVLLIAEPGPDFDDTWQLPGGPVLPGQTLTDALHPAVAAIGLAIGQITGYLGHHDHPGAQATARVFRFAVTVTDPGAICRHAGTGHRWAEDLDCPAGPPATMSTPASAEPLLADPLRAWARGIYPDEAGVELLIAHGVFLRRADFTRPFITIPATAPAWPPSTGPPRSPPWTAACPAPAARTGCSAWQPAWPPAYPSTSATPSPASTAAASSS